MNEKEEKSNAGGAVIGIILICVLGFWAYTAWLKPDSWQGIYETQTSNTVYATGGMSKEACMQWLSSTRANPGGKYNLECGSNCNPPTSELGVYVCESTFD